MEDRFVIPQAIIDAAKSEGWDVIRAEVEYYRYPHEGLSRRILYLKLRPTNEDPIDIILQEDKPDVS